MEAKTTSSRDTEFPCVDTFTSFGDQGTTASVTSYGRLVKMTKFLGVGRSGFFSADHQGTPEPASIQDRAEFLMELSTCNWRGIGLCHSIEEKPELDFICGRWPRFTFKRDGYSVKVKYFTCDGTIFQQFVVETKYHEYPSEGIDLSSISEWEMDKDIQIRDLEWEDEEYSFNKHEYGAGDYQTRLENYGYSLVRTHKGFRSEPLADGGPRDQAHENESNNSQAIELVVGAFVDGQAQKLQQDSLGYAQIENQGKEIWERLTELGKRVEITFAYRSQRQAQEPVWYSWLIQASGLIRMREAFSGESLGDIHFSSHSRLNFVIQRNLEHILSVCCVPVDRKWGEKELHGIAITCGDMSGHRLVTSASL